MADTITPTRRSENMRRIRAKNTSPEMVVRRLLYSLGYRYRLHAKDLPGKPDVVFRSKKQAIFIHGCFGISTGNAAPEDCLQVVQSIGFLSSDETLNVTAITKLNL